MAKTAGRLVNLYKGAVIGGTLVATARTKTMTVNREGIDVTADDSAAWAEMLDTIGSRSVEVSVEGIVDLAARTFLIDAFDETLDVYTLQWENGSEFTGTFQLGNYEESGDHTGEFTFSTTLSSSGAAAELKSILAADHPDLVAFYTMDNINVGTLVDETANANDGTIVGTIAVPGQILNALDFSGGDSVSLPPSDFILGQGSVSAWIDVDELSGLDVIVLGGANNAENDEYLSCLIQTTGAVQVYSADGISSPNILSTLTNSFPTSGYHHIVFMSDGSTTSVYIDASFVSLSGDTNTGRWLIDVPNINSVSIQSTPRLSPIIAAGKVDQWRYYDRALTQAEITRLFDEGTP